MLPFDSDLKAIAVSPDGSKLYAADGLNNAVSVIDLSINEVVAIVGVGSNPSNIAIAPDSSRVYVANLGTPDSPDNTVSVISLIEDKNEDGELFFNITEVKVGVGPSGLAITPDGSKVYVTNSGSDTISVIDTSANEVKTIPVGLGPGGIAITSNDCESSKVYVANSADGTVSVIDVQNDTVIGDPIIVGIEPRGIAITLDCSKVYVANSASNTVSAITTSTNEVKTIPVGSNPGVVVVSPSGSRVYIANSGSNTVSVINIEDDTVIGEPIEVGPNPTGIAITGKGSKLYVANSGTDDEPGNIVSVIEVKTGDGELSFNVSEIQVTESEKASPVAITIKPDSSRVYVANVENISEIDVSTDKVIDTIAVSASN
ncbi:MAG TPA: beta-propeller fold lactonase family protein [Thermodesulfobacteriota bacterium]|nr:beta-propeller fold lactonase family protein [Thermodesulfobacteriota bacterium]